MSIISFLHKFSSVYNNSTIYSNMEKWAPITKDNAADYRNILWVFQIDDINPEISEISKNLASQFNATRISLYELLQTTEVDYEIDNHGHSDDFKSIIREYTSDEYFRKLDITKEEPHTINTMISKTMEWILNYIEKHRERLFIIEAKILYNYPAYVIDNLLTNYPCMIPSNKILSPLSEDEMTTFEKIRKYVQETDGITTSMFTATK